MGQFRLEILGCGPQKTSTSWLAEILKETRGALCFPSGVKETFFWDRNFDRGLAWYMDHFQGIGRPIEFGPTYFHCMKSIERLHSHNPNLRVIVTLRDPAARSWSLYRHHFRKGRVRKDFEDADIRIPEIREASRYSLYLQRWIEVFGLERVLVLLQDDVRQDPASVIARVGRFIGENIKMDITGLSRRINVGGQPPSRALAAVSTRAAEMLRRRGLYGFVNIAKSAGLKRMVYGGSARELEGPPDKLRAQLVEEFEADIAYVEHLLGVDLAHWREGRPVSCVADKLISLD